MSDESDQIDQNFQDISDRIGDGERVIIGLRLQVENQRMALEKMQAKADADARAAEAKIIGAEVKNRMQEQALRLERDRIDELYRRLRKLTDEVDTTADPSTTPWQGFLVVRDGGVGGGSGTNCNYTYTVYTWGSTIGTDIPAATNVVLTGFGNGWRGLPTELQKANYGFGRLDGGVPVLLWVDEYPINFFECIPE